VLATLALAGGTAGGRSAQSIRVTSDLVVVDSQVVDRKTGAPLEGLTREDFTILEEASRSASRISVRTRSPSRSCSVST